MNRFYNQLLAARSYALGILILWQVLFIGLSNYVEFYPHRPAGTGELEDYREAASNSPQAPLGIQQVASVTDHWAQLTGQYQMWWLFAPYFPQQATFPTVELVWHDKQGEVDAPAAAGSSVWLSSSFEPQFPTAYLRLPSGRDRLFLYEMHLGLGAVCWNQARDEQSSAADQKVWRAHFRELVSRQQQSMQAYVQWRLAEFEQQQPQVPPPDEMILHVRIYPTPQPGTARPTDQQPVLFTLARFRPSSTKATTEWFDPFTHKFCPLTGLDSSVAISGRPQ